MLEIIQGIGCLILIIAILSGITNQTVNYKQDFHD